MVPITAISAPGIFFESFFAAMIATSTLRAMTSA
jgi:hypothetical protein